MYDGHGGEDVAKYASRLLHHRLCAMDTYRQGKYETALQEAFMALDYEMMHDDAIHAQTQGSTACTLLIKNNHLFNMSVLLLCSLGRSIVHCCRKKQQRARCMYCANAGDSRAVACVAGRAVALSVDHKPSLASESTRIYHAGGYVRTLCTRHVSSLRNFAYTNGI